jgi:uncharacterized protein (DUF488 family)
MIRWDFSEGKSGYYRRPRTACLTKGEIMSPVRTARPSTAPQLFTLGYQGLEPEQFVKLLKENKVKTVIDIRATARSHKAGFAKTSLEKHIESAGMRYLYRPGLGIPKEVRDAMEHGPELWKHYEDVILPAVRGEVKEAADFAMKERCVLICFEQNPAECHRHVLAKVISRRNHCEIVDLHSEPEPVKTRARGERPKRSEVTRRPHQLHHKS